MMPVILSGDCAICGAHMERASDIRAYADGPDIVLWCLACFTDYTANGRDPDDRLDRHYPREEWVLMAKARTAGTKP